MKRTIELTEEEQTKLDRKNKKLKKKKAKLIEKQSEVLDNQAKLNEKLKKPLLGEIQQEPTKEDSSAKVKSKKKKKKKSSATSDHVHETIGRGKAMKYLEVWATDRANWKFEKCRQIWLIQNCYDQVKIPDDKFDQLLEYIGSIKGQMRASALKLAQEKVAWEEKWKQILEDGKSEEEAKQELKLERQPAVVVSRAEEIISMLE
ncbi:hypothetical protein TCAL_08196 [Tigriopus californicus]|uniref:WKF domain-containing protein n=1 Tax=Tigriopus californicus TaxID=6832 RepID=A0A553NBA6_TIGCA|nr:uncharacterized protein C7orf50 homolog [Tigriopus californicus]TRY62721.1 hypothetical protein TCAL_08196 [Tigriopus californicus]|eukprot:TCALIF_08196-PA protein Name:"Similar to Uncharacterized protein C7orf50 homolog (Mus musculus)" AED:0.01 eAED:0.01 QI:160/1/1/1/0.5/0.33/3/59/203